ncbi:MAG: hypothetical protein FJ387_26970 [Verrucomicrobia bacterium]|nr:hypothetical protein [Verrucomicrobiota bacterium]
MKRTQHTLVGLLATALGAWIGACPGAALAQDNNHYPNGVEGIKGGTLPPPGFYIRDYNLFYFANRLNDANGDKVPIDFDAFVYAQAFRPVWITPKKLLGGYYGMDLLVPLIYTDVEAKGLFQDSEFGLGDLFVEPITLSWHGTHYDAGIGYGFWAPTGESTAGPSASAGKGFWSHMFTAGATLYPTEDKKWSLSLLNRYEIHMENGDTKITPGDTLTMEWGIGRALKPTIEVGVAGYYVRQITDDSGPAGGAKTNEQVLGVGPEISVACPKCAMFVSLRYVREFLAENRPEGNTITLTLTKKF